jgi:hypothetical protein
MLLNDANAGNQLSIRVTGYQFPDAPDPAQRFSWHMVAGQVSCAQGSWQFHWQALTCDESPRVSAGLRTVAESAQVGHRSPEPLGFMEPNLALRATAGGADRVHVEVDFDLEFQPPWHRHRHAGNPFTLSFTTTPDQLREAARHWDDERAPFPDGLS